MHHDKEKRGRPCGSTMMDLEVQRPAKKKKMQLLQVEKLVAFLCCSMVCLSHIPQASLRKTRDIFQAMGLLERSRWVMEWFHTHTREDSTTTFTISGYNVCWKAWITCIGLPMSTYYNLKKKFLSGIMLIDGPGKKYGTLNMSSQFTLSWLTVFAQKHADKMPDSTKLHLPCCLKKTNMYELMVEDAHSKGEKTVSMRHFFRLWKRFLPHIVIPKRSRFTVCDICNRLKMKISMTSDKKTRSALTALRDQHLRQQNLERRKYYKHAVKGRKEKEYLSIIIDGMDQEKTNLPHLLETPKSLSNGWRLKVNLMAAIVHGVGIYGFFDPNQWSHGSSYTISVLVHILSMMVDNIPDTLYLQLDNCPGQNKNRFMLGFLASLVQFGIFKKIKLSFLMVGHTHEDIDQVFSRYSVWLNRNSALTLCDLINGFEACYSPRPTGIQIHEVYNFASYLQLNDIVNHSKPHVYKLVKINDVVVIYYKKWSTDKEWIKCEGDSLLKTFDLNKPIEHIQPSTKDLNDKVESDVHGVARFYKDANLDLWWKDFFTTLKEQEDNWTEQSSNIMERLLAKKKVTTTQPEEEDNHMADLMANLNLPGINDPIPPVTIGKKKKVIKPVEDSSNLKVGQLVMTDMVKYCDEWPQIGQIISIDKDLCTIHWYKGSKTTAWTPATRRVKGAKGGRTEPFTECIDRCVIWHYGYTLTPSGMLGKNERKMVEQYFD